jgi:hypothetical protein
MDCEVLRNHDSFDLRAIPDHKIRSAHLAFDAGCKNSRSFATVLLSCSGALFLKLFNMPTSIAVIVYATGLGSPPLVQKGNSGLSCD